LVGSTMAGHSGTSSWPTSGCVGPYRTGRGHTPRRAPTGTSAPRTGVRRRRRGRLSWGSASALEWR
jgi:hypothetical protein